MAESISTNGFRAILAQSFYDAAIITGALEVAWGGGGHNPDGTPKTALPTQEALVDELRRQSASSIDVEAGLVRVTGELAAGDLVGEEISEFGIFLNDTLIGYRNMSLKIKDGDETMANSIAFLF